MLYVTSAIHHDQLSETQEFFLSLLRVPSGHIGKYINLKTTVTKKYSFTKTLSTSHAKGQKSKLKRGGGRRDHLSRNPEITFGLRQDPKLATIGSWQS